MSTPSTPPATLFPRLTPPRPPDEYIYNLKKTAFLNGGVQLGGTGVRNDFAVPDAAARKRDVQMVKDWIEVASKLGAPVIRDFLRRKRAPRVTPSIRR